MLASDELMALTTSVRSPVLVATLVSVVVPVTSPPARVAVTVPPVPEVSETVAPA